MGGWGEGEEEGGKEEGSFQMTRTKARVPGTMTKFEQFGKVNFHSLLLLSIHQQRSYALQSSPLEFRNR